MTTGTTSPPAPEFRTYGGWRTPGRPGLGKLGLGPTDLFFVAAVAVIACLAFSLRLALLTALGATALITPLVLTDRHHRTLLQAVTARTSWRFAHHAGQTVYRAGPTGRVPTLRWSLPGLAAGITAADYVDTSGRPFALLHHPHAHHVTAVIQACPEGASLVDDATIDHWVASWGEFLRVLGQDSSLGAASVTIETAPDPGTRLASELDQHVNTSAPQLAQLVMADIARSYPLTAAITTARIALTWTCTPRATGRRRPLATMAAEVGRRLPALCLALQATGAGAARPMTVAQLGGAGAVASHRGAGRCSGCRGSCAGRRSRCRPSGGWRCPGSSCTGPAGWTRPTSARSRGSRRRRRPGPSSIWLRSTTAGG
jgi:hypothetical protein